MCIIAREILRDLGDYHRLRLSEEALFSVLLPDIERLASAKIVSGLLDPDGQVRIGTVDILRHGFGTPRAEAAE